MILLNLLLEVSSILKIGERLRMMSIERHAAALLSPINKEDESVKEAVGIKRSQI